MGHPPHDIASDPLEVSGRVVRCADADGPLDGAAIGHGRGECHHHRVRHPHHGTISRRHRRNAWDRLEWRDRGGRYAD